MELIWDTENLAWPTIIVPELATVVLAPVLEYKNVQSFVLSRIDSLYPQKGYLFSFRNGIKFVEAQKNGKRKNNIVAMREWEG